MAINKTAPGFKEVFMSAINTNSLFQNIFNRPLSNSNNKASSSNSSNDFASLLQSDQLNGITDFNSMLQALSDPAKASAITSRTIEGYVDYNLKASFQTSAGQNLNLELNVKVSFKFEQAASAYSKNKKVELTGSADNEFSPENTAKRITDFAMGFLSAFQSNHSDKKKNDSITDFFDLAKNAISKGFDQAKSILGDLYGDTGQNTYDLVMKYLDGAKNNLLKPDTASSSSDSAPKVTIK